MTGIAGLLILGALAALANLIGGLLIVSSGAYRREAKLLKYLVALGAGFMLAAIFIEIVPETVALWTPPSSEVNPAEGVVGAFTLLLGGYLLIQLFEHTFAPHFHFGAETHPESLIRPSAAYAAIGGLTIHTFFDGVSIAAAFLADVKVGILVFIAIMLHKVPEGFTVASIMLASGRSSKKAAAAALAIGAATFAGVVGVALMKARFANSVAYALPFSAGVTLYVAASDLIPEVNRSEEKNPLVSVIVFAGVALFYLLHRLLPR
ncbi:MAG TPA: ZIP family metal transporter [Pyrinomonadaceae bacterium]|nr:ZIP family metal transporter [Pyrinomonadaceae bacterium]